MELLIEDWERDYLKEMVYLQEDKNIEDDYYGETTRFDEERVGYEPLSPVILFEDWESITSRATIQHQS